MPMQAVDGHDGTITVKIGEQTCGTYSDKSVDGWTRLYCDLVGSVVTITRDGVSSPI